MATQRSLSKTARRSSPSKGKKGPEVPSDAVLFIATGDGSWAYVRTLHNTTCHLRVGSEAFIAAVADLRTIAGDRVDREIAELADRWPAAGWETAIAADEDTAADELAEAA